MNPTVQSFLIDGQAWLRCPSCKKIHIHGTGEGTRSSHCVRPFEYVSYYMLAPTVTSLEEQRLMYLERVLSGPLPRALWLPGRNKGSMTKTELAALRVFKKAARLAEAAQLAAIRKAEKEFFQLNLPRLTELRAEELRQQAARNHAEYEAGRGPQRQMEAEAALVLEPFTTVRSTHVF